MLTLVIFLERK